MYIKKIGNKNNLCLYAPTVVNAKSRQVEIIIPKKPYVIFFNFADFNDFLIDK